MFERLDDQGTRGHRGSCDIQRFHRRGLLGRDRIGLGSGAPVPPGAVNVEGPARVGGPWLSEHWLFDAVREHGEASSFGLAEANESALDVQA